MIALDAAVDQTTDAQAVVHIILTLLGCEHLIEGELLPTTETVRIGGFRRAVIRVRSLRLHFDVLVVRNSNFRNLMSLRLLVRKHRPDSDADLDACVGLFLAPLWAELVAATAGELAVRRAKRVAA